MVSKKYKLKKINYVDILIVLFFVLLISVSLVPLLNILSLSISDDYIAIHNKGMLFPNFNHVSFDAYKAVFNSSAIYQSFFMSVLVTIVATLIHITVTICAGFALSDREMPFRNSLLFFVLFTMLFNGGLIPTYLAISSYGLTDNFLVLVLPGAVSGYSIVLMKNYICQMPKSMKEAAEIDGASPIVLLINIIVPLSGPIIATLCLFCAVGKWNDWTTAFFYIKEARHLWPFQNVLQTIVVNTDSSNAENIDLSKLGEAFKNALIVVSIIPVTILYLCTQKFLVKGLFIGSVKE